MFTLTLVTPEKKLVSGQEVEEIFIPGYRGELNILPGHAPLLTTLAIGIVKYRLKGSDKLYQVAVSGGYCHVTPNGINLLAETAERPEELDVERIGRALKTAEGRMAGEALDQATMEELQAKALRARVRQQVASGEAGKN